MGLVMVVLVLIIVVLMGVLAYAFLIKPAYSGYVIDLQTQGVSQGVEFTILTIMQQVSTCQQVPLTAGNQTINIIAVECLQLPSQ